MNWARASSPLRLGGVLGFAFQPLRPHEIAQIAHGGLEFFDDLGGLVHEPDFAGLFGLGAGKEGDGGVNGVLLLAEIEDVSVGLGGVENAIGARKGLNQPVVLEVLINIKRVEIFGIEAGQEHINDDGDGDLFASLLGHVGVGKLLVLDALLDVLIIKIEFADGVIGSEADVVIGDDGLEGGLLLLRLVLVVGLFLREVFLNLLNVLVALGGRGENAGDAEREELGIVVLLFGLRGLEDLEVFDGVVDGGGGEEGVEPAPAGGGVVLGEDGVGDGALGEPFAGLDGLAAGPVVVHVKTQDVLVFDGVGDGVGVQFFLEEVLRGS